MLFAVFIQDRTQQVVLTPETDFERTALARIPSHALVTLHRGSFYECQGGYFRHTTSDDSLMVRIDPTSKS